MSINHSTFDPRIVSPMACCGPDGDLSTYPKDSLHRVAITLELLSDLIGDGKGERDFLAYEDSRFALSLQLSGAAQVLEAVGDALFSRLAAALCPNYLFPFRSVNFTERLNVFLRFFGSQPRMRFLVESLGGNRAG